MIKVIQPSKKKFYTGKCDYCECVFSYQDEDIIHDKHRRNDGQPYGDHIICPSCGDIYWINKKYSAEGWTNGCK